MLGTFICSPEQPPSLLRADLAADQTTKLRSLARSKYVATAPRNIDWRFFFIAGLSTHACAVNGTCQGPSGSSSWRPSTTSCSCAAGALHHSWSRVITILREGSGRGKLGQLHVGMPCRTVGARAKPAAPAHYWTKSLSHGVGVVRTGTQMWPLFRIWER